MGSAANRARASRSAFQMLRIEPLDNVGTVQAEHDQQDDGTQRYEMNSRHHSRFLRIDYSLKR